jgi:hypothetical protein
MENTSNSIVYAVNSDLDDGLLYAEFENKDAAIDYAKQHLDKLPFVDELEVSYDANGEIEDVFNYKTIWDHTMSDQEAEAAVADATDTEDAYWDFKGNQEVEAEKNKHDIGDTTWFESIDNLVEEMEENEDLVECKECFDLFPKTDCIKIDFGYVCPTCHNNGKVFTVSDNEIFNVDFPEYEKMNIENDMIPEEPIISEVESNEEIPASEPVGPESEPGLTPEEAVPFLVNDEVEAVAGYEQAAEVVADSDLENKEEILDTIEHIKEEEEEHIEELQDLVDDEIVEVENDPISTEEEVEETEKSEEELVEKIDIDTTNLVSSGNMEIWGIEPVADNKYNAILLKSYEDISYSSDTEQEVVDEMYKVDGLFTFGFTKDGAPELHAWNTEIWRTLSGCEIIFEDPTYDVALEKVFSKTESLDEHVNKECPPIESDQELEGTDNAVVDCKVADVVTHSEDEKPVDCEGKKKPLEKPLAEKLDVTNGYSHIKSVATMVHKAVDNYTKDNKVATRPDGTSFYVMGDKTNSDPEKMKKIILDTLANDGYDPEVVQYIEKGNLYGYVIDKIRMTARMTLSHKNEDLTEGFIFSLNNEKDLAEFTQLCQEVGLKTIGDLDRFTKETAGEPGNILDKLRAYRKELGAEFQIKESLYNFTEEEMTEYNMDEDGISLDSYDEYVRCNWCGEVFTVDQCIFEANMGWLCDRCESAIRSRGEKLTILTNPTDDEIISTLTEAKKMTRDDMIAKEGTDDVDLVNAGREEEDRVEIVD